MELSAYADNSFTNQHLERMLNVATLTPSEPSSKEALQFAEDAREKNGNGLVFWPSCLRGTFNGI
jgi:hypothetical protein